MTYTGLDPLVVYVGADADVVAVARSHTAMRWGSMGLRMADMKAAIGALLVPAVATAARIMREFATALRALPLEEDGE